MSPKLKRQHARYLLVLVGPGVAATLQYILGPHLQDSSYLFFLSTTLFTAYFGGRNVGFLSLPISFVMIDYLFIKPYYSLNVDPGALFDLTLYATVSIASVTM